MTLGVVARADESGLGTLTREVVRHLHPDRVLLVDMHSLNRGGWHPHWYDGYDVTVTPPLMDLNVLDRWLSGLDNVWTAETFYDPRFDQAARSAGVHRALYVMPELLNIDRREQHAESYYLPCEWEGRNGGYPVLPMPVALDRLQQRTARAPARTFFHLPAPAMADRNGTEALLAALPHVDSAIELVIAGSNGKGEDRDWHVGNCTVKWLHEQSENYWDVWPEGIDALCLPRRYGVLSLPMLEAAALGLPVIATALHPQVDWFDARTLCECRDVRQVPMKGGMFPVHSPDPISLAQRIDLLATDADLAESTAKQNRAWAESRSWEALLPAWEKALR